MFMSTVRLLDDLNQNSISKFLGQKKNFLPKKDVCAFPINLISQEHFDGDFLNLAKHSLGLKDELIRVWWTEGKGQGHCDLLNEYFHYP